MALNWLKFRTFECLIEQFMNKLLYVGAIVLIAMYLCACEEKKQVGMSDMAVVDTVEVSTIKVCDTASYKAAEEDCKIEAQVEFTYPKFFVNKDKTDELQDLYTTSVLEIQADSMSLATAFPGYVEMLINSYKEVNGAYEGEDYEKDYEIAKTCNLQVKIAVLYNNYNLLSIGKEETVVINDKEPRVRHLYSTYNLEKMEKMSFVDLVGEENVGDMIELLKAKLRSDVNAKNDDELVDLGFYNIDNLEANDNFYVTNDSVVWNYLPRELSVFDEVQIALSRKDIIMLTENKIR